MTVQMRQKACCFCKKALFLLYSTRNASIACKSIKNEVNTAETLGEVRVRFAPSPTGELHLGSLRTAFINFLFARKHGGKFILRLEDTDQDRLVPGTAEEFERVLDFFGLARDEGPMAGGLFGPYKQSLRLDKYQKAAEVLIEDGHAYYCFCSEERLDILRRDAVRVKRSYRYDGRCRGFSLSEVAARKRNNEPSVIRFKFDPETIYFVDGVFGQCSIETLEGDFVLQKRDGYPTYHFANVVDDHLMQISTVIRGSEWLYSTPKHIRLFRAFDWPLPNYLHLPLIIRRTGKKLSKRDRDAFVGYYTDQMGYLPIAILNFLVRNGAGIKDHTVGELYHLEELINRFDSSLLTRNNFTLDEVSLNNYGKLAFQLADPEQELLPAVCAHLARNSVGPDGTELDPDLVSDLAYITRVMNFLQRGEESFTRLGELTAGDFRFFFSRPRSPNSLLRNFPNTTKTDLVRLLSILLKRFVDGNGDATSPLSNASPVWRNEELIELAAEVGWAKRDLLKLFRIALIDSRSGPPIRELLDFFSSVECRARLQRAIEMLMENEN